MIVYYWLKSALSTLTRIMLWLSLTIVQLQTRCKTNKLTGQDYFSLCSATYSVSVCTIPQAWCTEARAHWAIHKARLIFWAWHGQLYLHVEQETADSQKTECIYKQEAECVTTDIQHLIAIAEHGKKKKKVSIKKKMSLEKYPSK